MVKKHWLSISSKCNNYCLFCLDADNQNNGFFKSDNEVIKGMKVGLKNKATRLILSGGEATIHPHFIEFVKKAKELGYKEVQVITNGRMFAYEKFLDQAVFAGLTEITFSIHSHKRNAYEMFSGIKGSYVQTINGLKNSLQYSHLILNMDIVINKLNYKDIYDTIIFFADRYGIYEYDLLQVIPMGRAWRNEKKLFYNIEKALPYLTKVFELAKNDKRFHIWTNRFPAQYLEGYEFLIQDPFKIKDDVLGAGKMFEKYLNKGKIMDCYQPKRCQLCNLKPFCDSLIKFKNLNAKLKKEYLDNYFNSPRCYSYKKDNNYSLSNAINFVDFLNFYLNNLYTVKSLRCNKCRFFSDCQGADIRLIKEKGFKVLTPII